MIWGLFLFKIFTILWDGTNIACFLWQTLSGRLSPLIKYFVGGLENFWKGLNATIRAGKYFIHPLSDPFIFTRVACLLEPIPAIYVYTHMCVCMCGGVHPPPPHTYKEYMNKYDIVINIIIKMEDNQCMIWRKSVFVDTLPSRAVGFHNNKPRICD